MQGLDPLDARHINRFYEDGGCCSLARMAMVLDKDWGGMRYLLAGVDAWARQRSLTRAHVLLMLRQAGAGRYPFSAPRWPEPPEAVQAALGQQAVPPLRGADLAGAMLSFADLAGADLTGADLTGASLSHAVLHRTVLHRADLTDAKMANADLRGAALAGANFTRADLRFADLSGQDLTEVVWQDPWVAGATLTDVRGLNEKETP